MKEAGLLVGVDHAPLYWHLPAGRTAVYMPDSDELWNQIWENRSCLLGFAHTHPGSGVAAAFPSETDLSTFQGVEQALGRRLCWWILSQDQIILHRWWIHDVYLPTIPSEEPAWASELRVRSQQETP